MTRWPQDAPRARVLQALGRLGYRVVRIGNHLSLARDCADGTQMTMTLPSHPTLKGATLQAACRLAGISREEFLRAYRNS